MSLWSSGEIRHVSRVWRDHEQRSWRVVFDLARLGGRIECVGMAIRPCADDEGSDAGEPATAAREEAATSLRPLRATTVRDLPFGDVLRRALREAAKQEELIPAAWSEAPHLGDADLSANIHDPDVLEHAQRIQRKIRPPIPEDEFSARYQRLLVDSGVQGLYEASALQKSPRRRGVGRPPTYDRADLERVATHWRQAHASGSPSPTKDVADAFGYTRDQAAKLVMKCRKAGLLPPAIGRGGQPLEQDGVPREATDEDDR